MFDKRQRFSPSFGVTLLLALALPLGACGGTSSVGSESPDQATASPSPPLEQTVASPSPSPEEAHGHTHAGEEVAEGDLTYAELRETEEFQAAYPRYEICMLDAGYPEANLNDSDGVLLRDGTRFTADSDFTLDGPVADFFFHAARCEIESGVEAIEEQHGFGGEWVASPAETAEYNQKRVTVMACVEAHGWDVPEPLLLPGPGILVFDIRIPPEEQAAYDLDYAECVEEQGGF